MTRPFHATIRALAGSFHRVHTLVQRLLAAALIGPALLLSGCATTSKLWPSGKKWREAATNAAKHPGTWVPLAGAGVVATGGWDHEISDWARRETPLFGSATNAEDYSDSFRAATHAGMIVTALLVREPGEKRWPSMLERMAWEHVGVAAALILRDPIRRITDRQRPNGEPRSFPSGHSTTAFANTAMTYRNLEALRISPAWKYGAMSAEAGCAALTAWARVEAGKHYPTDVLAGAALGNFVALLVHDAFLGHGEDVAISMGPDRRLAVRWRLTF
jgi:hypothetical protein